MMDYQKFEDKIVIFNIEDFNVVQSLDCGQIFRYSIDGNRALIFSKDKKAVCTTYQDRIEIETTDVDYFERFLDLETDYAKIKEQLKNDSMLTTAVEYGYGIRIFKNDLFEMIVSFIISANNNILRIKRSIEFLCLNFGSPCSDYFAFPTLVQLKLASVQDFKDAGLGYRAEQLYSTIQSLTKDQIKNLKTMSRKDQFDFLISLKGIGEKVANCIMLFGLGVKDVFPVDTWINKVYNKINNTVEHDRKKITKEFSGRYGDLSGYAQQYFFYYFRDNHIK